MENFTAMIKEQIFADIAVNGGMVMLDGIIVKETEKAVKIDYAIQPVFAGAYCTSHVMATKTTWVPKSQIIKKDGMLTIKPWFANNHMKSYPIKPYKI